MRFLHPSLALSLGTLAILAPACARRAYETGIEVPISNGQWYLWNLRAWYTNDLWVPVDDSLDIVLLRDRCGVPAGHGQKGCYAAEDSSVSPHWKITEERFASIRALPRGSWYFGPGSAGARVYGRVPGITTVVVHLAQGTFADTIQVLPRFDRLRIEPRDSEYVAGDTVWFRVMGMDSAGREVTTLPWPYSFGRQVGAPSTSGAIPIVFDYPDHPGLAMLNLWIHLGSKADTLRFRILPKRVPSAPPPP